ncbi:cytochrome b/b6 domain-containing protein [Litorivicinus sp.]|nr:cytochrome b/b6 domain-containing protein [Litorivicinus sp.]
MNTRILVWDIWIRLGHWGLTAAIVFQILSGGETDLIEWHAIVGTCILGWVLFRVIWGFFGPQYARFNKLSLSPARVRESWSNLLAGRTEPTPGHTILGGLAIYVLLAVLAMTALVGLMSTDDIVFDGPLVPYIHPVLANQTSNIHELLSTSVIVLAITHVSAVIYHTLRMKERLILGMIDGRKKSFGYSSGTPHPSDRKTILTGFFLMSFCIGGTYWLFLVYLGF